MLCKVYKAGKKGVKMFQKYFPQALYLKQHNQSYLDSAATTLKLGCVIETVNRFYKQEVSNVHRGDHYLSDSLTLRYENVREKIKNWIGANSAKEIIFTKSTTESLNLLSFALENLFQEGDEILLTEMEHHSNLLPWQALAQRKKLKLKFLPVTRQGHLQVKEWEKQVNKKTKLFAFTYYSNALGLRNPVEKLISLAQEKDILTVLDAAQAMTAESIQVHKIGCDFLAFSGHKLFAPSGVGVLYAKKKHLKNMHPWQLGGGMVEEVNLNHYEQAEAPQCFEAGTPPIEAVLALGSVLDFLNQIGRRPTARKPVSLGRIEGNKTSQLKTFFQYVSEHKQKLIAYVTEEFKKIPDIQIIGQGVANKAPIISFILKDVHSRDLGQLISQDGVAVRSGHHCCIPLMKKLNLPSGTVRASFSIYNNEQDIKHLILAVRKARSLLK